MKKIKTIWKWFDDRSGITENILPLLKHPVPPGARWAYIFGSATLFCFLLQVVTGIGLAFLYQPSSEEAYKSLQFITRQASMGKLLRGIHYFGASAMIILAGIHMLRVFITASYKYPREMSWISGVFLLLFTITMGFTGQLLRWDSNGIWSSVVAAQQLGRVPVVGKYLARLLLGGDTIGGQSLSRFFAMHVFILPALIFLFVGYHLYLVLRNGISEPPSANHYIDPATYRTWYRQMLKDKGIPFWPNAAWRDALFSSLIIITIFVLAWVWGPPAITAPPDPSLVHTTPRPDWYMLPIFALFALMPPKIESYVIFIGPVITIIFLLAFPLIYNKGERRPVRRPWSVFVAICVVVFIASLLVTGTRSPWSPNFKTQEMTTKEIHVNKPDEKITNGLHLFYTKGCQYCHQIGKTGGKTGPALTGIGSIRTPDQLTIRIVNGSDNMPAYGGMLKKDELEALVAFLASCK